MTLTHSVYFLNRSIDRFGCTAFNEIHLAIFKTAYSFKAQFAFPISPANKSTSKRCSSAAFGNQFANPRINVLTKCMYIPNLINYYSPAGHPQSGELWIIDDCRTVLLDCSCEMSRRNRSIPESCSDNFCNACNISAAG